MEIVDADRIRRSGALHVPGVLKRVPGVDVLQWGSSNYDVSLRGYNQAFSQRMLVLVDGRQVYADHYGYTPWTAIPTEMSAIRQIEVVKGPNTALFGFNAVSGVINIVTYNPLHEAVNTLSVTGGSFGTIEGSARGHASGFRPLGPAAFRQRRSGQRLLLAHTGPYRSPGPGPEQPRRGQCQWRDAGQRTCPVHPGPQPFGNPDQRHRPNLRHDTRPPSGQLGQGAIECRYQFRPGATVRLYELGRAKSRTTALFAMDFADQTMVVQLQDVLRIGESHVVRAALEYRHNEVNTTPFTGAAISYEVVSASAMWNWALSPTLVLDQRCPPRSPHPGRTGAAGRLPLPQQRLGPHPAGMELQQRPGLESERRRTRCA